MNQSILNESLLQKDIEQIKFYAMEEKVTLTKITGILKEISNSYTSSNTAYFLNHVEHLNQNIVPIYEKRNQYGIMLNRVMEQYNRLANETIQKFNQDV